MALDPDDPRPPYVQVANALRAAILTKKFAAGDKLPSRAELAKAYNVAPMTVQNALRELREEGLIVSPGRDLARRHAGAAGQDPCRTPAA